MSGLTIGPLTAAVSEPNTSAVMVFCEILSVASTKRAEIAERFFAACERVLSGLVNAARRGRRLPRRWRRQGGRVHAPGGRR